MARPARYHGRRAPLVALALVMAFGLAAGLAFEQTELRGVTVSPPAEPPAQSAPAPTPQGAPTGFRAAFEAGITHLRQGNPHGAVQAFETARRANPHAPEVYANLGFAYLELGQPAAARAAFETAGAIAPGQVNAYFGLAEALDALGDGEGAMGAMRTYLHLAPGDDPFRRRAMSALWEWESRRDTALAAASGATEPAPTPAETPSAPAGPTAADTPSEAGPTAAETPSEAGDTLFDAPLQTLDGDPASLAAYRGKFLILNVWAAWCGPCRAELPSLDRLNQALDPELFAVAGVSIDRQRVFTREFLADLGVGFPNYWDGEGRLTKEILAANVLPLTVIIDPQGEIVLGYEGARDWNEPGLVAALGDLAQGDGPLAERIAKLQEELQ
ncbi:MAG: redoxin domain-containing protein [Proteobacteria bacterium]|nr:redoxin domain-containing protein [Pseudomonadota bacterium]